MKKLELQEMEKIEGGNFRIDAPKPVCISLGFHWFVVVAQCYQQMFWD